MRKSPNIEMVLTGMLRPLFPGVCIGRTAPKTRQERMVTIRRQGGNTTRFVDRPRIGVNVWDVTPEAATALASEVAAAIREAAGNSSGPIKRASTYGLIEVPEETELHQRYFTADVTIRTIV